MWICFVTAHHNVPIDHEKVTTSHTYCQCLSSILRTSIATGVTLVYIRLLPFPTPDIIRFLRYSINISYMLLLLVPNKPTLNPKWSEVSSLKWRSRLCVTYSVSCSRCSEESFFNMERVPNTHEVEKFMKGT